MIFYSTYLVVVGVLFDLVERSSKEKKRSDAPGIPENKSIVPPKIQPEVYKGIYYVRLANLPAQQKQFISQTGIRHIKIKTESFLLSDCIQYHDYEKWYESVTEN
ncbi:hypothetical protein WSM22_36710 [Cytophagales bacterium WSM2-2]|nr:hypothetical protein WSM22_36710 [Cytophagales bacterium WSM2-2]